MRINFIKIYLAPILFLSNFNLIKQEVEMNLIKQQPNYPTALVYNFVLNIISPSS